MPLPEGVEAAAAELPGLPAAAGLWEALEAALPVATATAVPRLPGPVRAHGGMVDELWR